MSAVSATGLSKSEKLCHADSVSKPSEMEDSFFSTWLSPPSQQQETRSSSSDRSAKLQSVKQVSPRSPKERKNFSSPGTAPGENVSTCESKLHGVTASEQSTVGVAKSEAAPSQLQPISVSITDDRKARPQKTDVAGLLMSAKISSSDYSRLPADESVQLNEGHVSDAAQNDMPDTGVAVLVSRSNDDESETVGSNRVDDGDVLSARLQPDVAPSFEYLNSHLSSSILSPNPEELLGMESDMQPVTGWNDMVGSEVWLSSAVDLPEVEKEDSSTADVRTKLEDQLDDGDVDFRCDGHQDGQSCNKDDMLPAVSEDTTCMVSSDVDAKVLKEVSSLEGSMKEISSSLEGSLASADELSEGNKTVVAEDSDLCCDDTDVDEMQMSGSGSARSGLPQEHSMTVLGSELCDSSDDGKEQGPSSGTDAVLQPSEFSAASTDNISESSSSPPSSRCVKNLLEEAMADGCTRGSMESVEPVRIESGGNSGHTSADEIDTTTSSDIEIISHTSSMNGRSLGW